MKRPDKQSDPLAYRIWLKQQDEMRYQFQTKWFEVVLKERGSESSNSPVGVFEQNEREETLQRKSTLSDLRKPKIN